MNKKIFIAGICIILIVLMPVCHAQILDSGLDTGAEDIIIGVKSYEPTVLVSSLLEDGDVPVYVNLFAYSSNPFITVEDVKSFNIYETSGDTQYVRSKSYTKPTAGYSFDDMGYLKLWLKRIEREKDIPNIINLNLTAKVYFDVESRYLGGVNRRTLVQLEKEEFEDSFEDYAFFGGKVYVWVRKITKGTASVEIYDSEANTALAKTVLSEGEESAPFYIFRGSTLDQDRARIQLNEIKGAGVIAGIKLGTSVKEYEKGNKLYYKVGDEEKLSDWFIEEIHSRDGYVIFHKTGYAFSPVLFKGMDFSGKDLNNETVKEEIREKFSEEFAKETREGVFDAILDFIDKLQGDESVVSDFGEDEFVEANLNGLIEMKNDFGELPVIRTIEKVAVDNVNHAKMIVGGEEAEYLFAGESITDKCKLTEIKEETNKIEIKSETGDDFVLNVGDILDIEKCGEEIELVSIGEGPVADISMMGGSGRSVSTSSFSVHIPVEKRMLFNYTDEELDEKINKTREKIEKLNKTITDLEELVTAWGYACTATVALFTITSFLGGFAGHKTGDGDGSSEVKFGGGGFNSSAAQPLKDSDGKSFYSQGGNLIYADKFSGTVLEKVGSAYEEYHKAFYKDGEKPTKPEDKVYHYDADSGKAKELNKKFMGEPKAQVDEKEKRVTLIPSRPGAYEFVGGARLPGVAGYVVPGLDEYRKAAREEWQIWYGNIYYKIQYDVKRVEVWSAWNDGVIGTLDDRFVTELSGQLYDYLEDKRPIGSIDKINSEIRKGDTTFKLGDVEYDLEPDIPAEEPAVECKDVLGPTKCKILFNACDPVICPPSRFDMNGKYKVNNVIQSGFVGSIFLGLHNFPETLVPICLSGVLAALKNLMTNYMAYEQCLVAAKVEGKSIGLCDTINSIYLCELIWKELYTFFRIRGGVIGSLFEKLGGKGGGGGEYIVGGIESGIQESKKTLNYFTQQYATSAFSSYKGASMEEIGTEICRSAIYGKIPGIGELFEEVSTPENPPQFTAYMQEHAYSPSQRQSRYKVYYHIYAGTQSVERAGTTGIRYAVFLRGGGLPTRYVTSGLQLLEFGNFVDESEDFVADSGYEEICVQIDEDIQCGFGKIVSSSFFLNKVGDYIVSSDINRNIKNARQCRSDVLDAAGGGYVPRVQVQRRCSVENPYVGLGANKEDDWKEVGDCGYDDSGNYLGKCWVNVGALEGVSTLSDTLSEVRDSVVKPCADLGGKICSAFQSCTGSIFEDTVETSSGSGDVVCCISGDCVDTEEKKELAIVLDDASSEVGELGLGGTEKELVEGVLKGNKELSDLPDDFRTKYSDIYDALVLLDQIRDGVCDTENLEDKINEIKDVEWRNIVAKAAKACDVDVPVAGSVTTSGTVGLNLEGTSLVGKHALTVSGDMITLETGGPYDIKVEILKGGNSLNIKSCNILGIGEVVNIHEAALSTSSQVCNARLLFSGKGDQYTLKVSIEAQDSTKIDREYTVKNNEPMVSGNYLLCDVHIADDMHDYFCEGQAGKRCSSYVWTHATADSRYAGVKLEGGVPEVFDNQANCLARCLSLQSKERFAEKTCYTNYQALSSVLSSQGFVENF